MPRPLVYQALSTSGSDEAQSGTSLKECTKEDPDSHSGIILRGSLKPTTIIADVLSIFCPLACLVFGIVILLTDGRTIDEAYFNYQNAVTTVGFT